ncbi:MAG: ketopantoate reductase family protein [Proteobacteria bacterium]|nr:ketopantoate reductase family protein [Burkholderiales bacterium]
MKILVLGAGAIGGYYGGRLAEAGADVTFLVRPRRLEQLQRDGLVIESPAFGDAKLNVAAVTTIAGTNGDRPQYDIVLLTSKAYDLESALDAVRPALGARTAILPLLNGYAHIDRLTGEFGEKRVIGGLAKIQATLSPEGVVRQLNDWRYITFGELDGHESTRVTELKRLFDATPILATVSQNIRHDLWTKLVHLSTVAGMTCLMRGSVGEIARTPEGTELMNAFFDRNVEIATRAGFAPKPGFVAEFRTLFADRDTAYSASMARDIERGGPIEADHILGFMLERCRAFGLDDALHMVAHTHCKTYEARRAANRLP